MNSEDPDENDIFYLFDWGDGIFEGWLGPHESGSDATYSHTWNKKGTYTIRVKAKDINGVESDWKTLQVTAPKIQGHGIPQGTQITMATGTPVTTKSIELLQVGEFISSYNPTTQEVTIAEIVEVCEYTEDLPDQILFNGILEVTTEQTLYINRFEWIDANDTLLFETMLENIPDTPFTTEIPITSKEPTSLGGTVYDLVIRPLYGEAVGYWANGILVGGWD